MTDERDASTEDETESAATERTVAALLLALQAVDTEADQLTHRRATSPERDAADVTAAAVRQWERRRDALDARIAELGAAIESAETQGADLTTHRQRLEQQLKTVIAPREAEALMHEIATIQGQQDELDNAELEALEEQSTTDDLLGAHRAAEAAVRDAAGAAATALATQVGDIDADLARLAEQRETLRADISAAYIATYDRKRAALGVAVAPLVGKQCQGCHMELSAAEIDTVKDEAAATGVTDCPDCGRLLIV